MTTPRRLALVLGLPVALGGLLSLAQCNSDGVTPVCPADGGDCITPPGTSSASVVITPGSGGTTNGSGGSGGSTTTGGSGTSATGGSGGSGGSADGGLLGILDAALDIKLGQ